MHQLCIGTIKRIRTLEQRYPSSRKLSLDNMLALLKRMGSPHHRLPPVIHIAGTNGKGSTQAFLKSVLCASGYRVHAYTSPHLVNFAERIVIGGHQITDGQLNDLLDYALAALGNSDISWFELVTAVAFQAFAETHGDVVLLETGLGGRLDATNVVDHPACSIITAISYDHQNVLGFSLEQIATEKAEIIKSGSPVIACQQLPAVHNVIAKKAQSVNSPLFYQTAEWDYRIDSQSIHDPYLYRFINQTSRYATPALYGQHQLQNAGLALTALKVLQPILPTKSLAINTGLSQVKWPARLQNLHDHPYRKLLPTNTKLFLDGAHNPAGINTVISFIKNQFDDEPIRPAIIFGALRNKNLTELLSPLKNYVQQIIAVPIDGNDAYLPNSIVSVAQNLGILSFAATSVAEALKMLSNQQTCSRIVIICGSLYLAGHVLSSRSIADSSIKIL